MRRNRSKSPVFSDSGFVTGEKLKVPRALRNIKAFDVVNGIIAWRREDPCGIKSSDGVINTACTRISRSILRPYEESPPLRLLIL